MISEAPILRSADLHLVPFAERHFTSTYIGWLNDPTVVRYSEQRHRTHTIETCAVYVEGFRNGLDQLWAIEIAADDAHVGNISVTRDPHNGLADIGILIGADQARGRGFGLQAWSAVVQYLEAVPELRKITGGCISENIAMVRIMQSSGMRLDGQRTNHYLVEGSECDLVYFARVRGVDF